MSDKSTVLDKLDFAYIVRKTATTTTLATSASATDTTIDVADDTSFSDGDAILINGELSWIDGSPTSDTITLGRPLQRAHDSGVTVTKATVYDTGAVLQEGANWSLQGTSVDIPVATARLPIATLDGSKTMSLGWTGPSISAHLFALATGIPLAKVVGSGTAATPTVLTTDGSEFGTEVDQVYIVGGTTFGGTTLAIEAWQGSTRVEGFNLPLARNQATPLPFNCSTSTFLFETGGYTGAFTPDNTYAANGGSVWNILTEAGIFIKTATTTTLNGAVSAGATSATLTSGTSFSDDDWVLISAGGGDEITQLKNKSTNTFGLKIPAYRNWASGVTVTKLTKVLWADIDQSGATVALNTSSEDVPSALSATAVATRIGAAEMSVNFNVINQSLANIAYSLGVPQSDIVSGRFLADGDNIGSAVIPGAWLQGSTKNGATVSMIFNGVNLDLSSIVSNWTSTGAGATLPQTWKPTSCITMTQYSS